MDRRTIHRRGSYKNQKKNGGFGWAFLAVAVIVALGTALYFVWPMLTDNTEQKQNVVQEKPHTDLTAKSVLADMTLKEKVYQMLFVTPESITGVGQVVVAGDTTRAAIESQPVGGLVYFAPNLMSREQVSDMISATQGYSKIGLFTGIDEEGGRVSRLTENPQLGYSPLPSMKEIGEGGEPQAAYQHGKTLAERLTKLGFNVDFAPVADVLIHSDNTEIGNRAFGRDAETVAFMVPEVVSGLQEGGVRAVLKHFPGHGSALSDAHTGYTESLRTYDQLRETEFLPFASGIEAGADFVMVSHITLVNEVEEDVAASLSYEVVTEWLKEELGFEGIIITDSFAMGAITEHYSQAEAAVLAVKAGVDMILIPADVAAVAGAIMDAVESGEIKEERIDESVSKILMCKDKMGLLK